IEPATARAIFSARFGVNPRWVKSRWKPTVTPWPVTAYRTTAMTRSRQCSARPHNRGTATATATTGPTTRTLVMAFGRTDANEEGEGRRAGMVLSSRCRRVLGRGFPAEIGAGAGAQKRLPRREPDGISRVAHFDK